MDDDSWNQMLKKRKEKAPALIEVIRNLETNIHGLEGVSNLIDCTHVFKLCFFTWVFCFCMYLLL